MGKAKEPLAACMNGVKGSAVSLNERRGRADCLHEAIDQARIDRATLDALLDRDEGFAAPVPSLLRGQGGAHGKETARLVGPLCSQRANGNHLHVGSARAFVLENFGAFSPRLRDFAARAFAGNWIDAEPRDGKVGGAFCAAVPGVKESRILVQLRRVPRPGGHRRARAGSRVPQRVRLRRGKDRAPANHAHDPGGDGVHHVRDDRQHGGSRARKGSRRKSSPYWRTRSSTIPR